MFLRDFENYDSVIELSKIIVTEVNDNSSACVAGVYKNFNENKVFLYRKEGKLKLGINDKEILVTNRTRVILNVTNFNNYNLSVYDDNKLFFELNYFFDSKDYIFEEDYVSSFIEEEDFNFGLFLENVINNEGRRNSVFIH
jgi:hypothetical protein